MKAALATIFGCFLGGIAALVLALFLIESFGGGLLDFFSGSDTYVEGSAYGFTIGSTKEETFRDLWEFNEDSPVTFFQYDIPGSLHIFELRLIPLAPVGSTSCK